MSDPRPSDKLGGLYEETGLFCGPSATWNKPAYHIQLVRLDSAPEIAMLWGRMVSDLPQLERHFGYEGYVPRPRAHDSYFAVWRDESLGEGKGCGDGAMIGLAYTQQPTPTTMAYGFGLFAEAKGQHTGCDVKAAILAHCFARPKTHRVECEVYGSNPWSLRVLHGRGDPMKQEGIQKAVMEIDGIFYDRVLFGITREEWERICE